MGLLASAYVSDDCFHSQPVVGAGRSRDLPGPQAHHSRQLFFRAGCAGDLARHNGFSVLDVIFSHQFCGALLAIAFCLLLKISREEVEPARRRLIYMGVAGLLLGCSVISEYPTVLLAGLISIYTFWAVKRLKLPPAEKWKLLGMWMAGGLAAGNGARSPQLRCFRKSFLHSVRNVRADGFLVCHLRSWLARIALAWSGAIFSCAHLGHDLSANRNFLSRRARVGACTRATRFFGSRFRDWR